jgi:hypothetical protein
MRLNSVYQSLLLATLTVLFTLIFIRLNDVSPTTTRTIESGVCALNKMSNSTRDSLVPYTLYANSNDRYYVTFSPPSNPTLAFSSSPTTLNVNCPFSSLYTASTSFEVSSCTLNQTGNTYQKAFINSFLNYGTTPVSIGSAPVPFSLSATTFFLTGISGNGMACGIENTVKLDARSITPNGVNTGMDGLLVVFNLLQSSATTSLTWTAPLTITLK